jgi:hypothetical protein
MQAITTKFLAPTNSRGARIKASCDAGSMIIPFPCGLNDEQAHAAAAMALVRKLGWTPENGYNDQWHGGSVNGHYVFVYGDGSTYSTSFSA